MTLRKSQKVYRSPSLVEPAKTMEIDEKDEEAGTILMALAHHATRIQHQQDHYGKPTKSHSMSIRNLLDSESDASMLPPHASPYHSLSTESRRRNSYHKKGFQICIAPRRNSSSQKTSFRHPSSIRIPTKTITKYKRNTTHIHISYRIHAHKIALHQQKYDTSSYPSAFRLPSQIHDHWRSHHHHHYHYQQDV